MGTCFGGQGPRRQPRSKRYLWLLFGTHIFCSPLVGLMPPCHTRGQERWLLRRVTVRVGAGSQSITRHATRVETRVIHEGRRDNDDQAYSFERGRLAGRAGRWWVGRYPLRNQAVTSMVPTSAVEHVCLPAWAQGPRLWQPRKCSMHGLNKTAHQPALEPAQYWCCSPVITQ